jgi:hypothetical protein
MNNNLMTITQIDEHVKAVSATPKGPAGLDWCGTYRKIAPILKFVSVLLHFFKPAWAQLLDSEVAIMDAACSGPTVIQAISTELGKNSDTLAQSVAANTPAPETSTVNSKSIFMANEIDELKAAVAKEETVTASAIALLKGLKQKLDDAIASGDPAQLHALSQELGQNTDALAQAVTDNTPAE